MTIRVLVDSSVPVIVGEGVGEGVEVFNITIGRDAVAGGDSRTSGSAAGGRYWEIQAAD
jgi:hypothetical protein